VVGVRSQLQYAAHLRPQHAFASICPPALTIDAGPRIRSKLVFKYLTFVLVAAVVLTAAPLIVRSQPVEQSNGIRIVVSGVRNRKGSVICSLWTGANADAFPKTGTEMREVSVPIHQGRAVCEFNALPAGAYAGTVFHDENGNGKFDRRFGYPLEGYGFTNNINPTIEAPPFSECKIQYAGNGILTLSIAMIYR